MTSTTLLARPAPHAWSGQERGVLVRAAMHSFPCGVGSPWTLQVRGHRAELSERFGASSWTHDGVGRDRVIACGAALAGVVVAARMLGWLTETELLGDPARPELVAGVAATGRHRPTSADVRRFQAIFDRGEPGVPVDPAELSEEVLAEVLRTGTMAGVRLVPLSAGATGQRKQTLEAGLLVVTTSDGRRDQLLAGTAMQEASLAARTLGLTVAPSISPFQFREFRQRVVRACRLGGSPQLLLRLGRDGGA
ncbi:hypothetical protein [Prauserella cavernicola]|uniref:Nitroreductase domain-containing protein n=1 Tax=Prauserella cavernicola TaxID=2800127 RepID=A0A934QP45_9PSEU|nr:hypothetical protein [Prauserella cavernicola]MBK1782834.1 hypothetical protein [Prauserella cavernicola]